MCVCIYTVKCVYIYVYKMLLYTHIPMYKYTLSLYIYMSIHLLGRFQLYIWHEEPCWKWSRLNFQFVKELKMQDVSRRIELSFCSPTKTVTQMQNGYRLSAKSCSPPVSCLWPHSVPVSDQDTCGVVFAIRPPHFQQSVGSLTLFSCLLGLTYNNMLFIM